MSIVHVSTVHRVLSNAGAITAARLPLLALRALLSRVRSAPGDVQVGPPVAKRLQQRRPRLSLPQLQREARGR